MNTRKLILLFTALVGLAASAFAQTTEATVTKITGTASAKLPDGSTVAITQGMKLPQGAEIITGAASQVTVQAHEGIVAIAAANTTITVEQLSVSPTGVRNATLSLKSGNLASSLDPTKKSTNNYAVRTPKGVAAARGTTYSVAFDGVTYSVTVVAGVVQSFSMTGASVNVSIGQVSSSSTGEGAPTTQTLAEAVAANPSAGEGLALLAAAVASVSTNIADVSAVIGTIASQAGTTQAATNAIATATASAAATAATNTNLTNSGGGASGVASSIVGAAVSGAASAGNSAAAGTIVATTVVAVSTTTGASVSSIATTLSNTANQTAGVSVNATNITNAANTAIQSGTTASTGSTIVVAQETAPGITQTAIIETPVTTIVQPIDPSTVSRSQ